MSAEGSGQVECRWKVADGEGQVRCGNRLLTEGLKALGIAQYTFFDQRYVDGAIEKMKTDHPECFSGSCSFLSRRGRSASR